MSSEDEEFAMDHPEVNPRLLNMINTMYIGDAEGAKQSVKIFYKRMRRLLREEDIDREVYEFIQIGKEYGFGQDFEDALIQENNNYKKFKLDKDRISLLNAKQRLALMNNENRRIGSDSVLDHLDNDVITKLLKYITNTQPQRRSMSRPVADDQEIHDWLNDMDTRIEIEKMLPTTLRLQNAYRNKRNRLTKKSATRIQRSYRNRLNRDRMTEYSPD